MPRKRKKKNKPSRVSLRSKGSKKNKYTTGFKLFLILKILTAACLLAGIVIGLSFLQKYVKQKVPLEERIGRLELVNPPKWINQQLREKILLAASQYGQGVMIDQEAAELVAHNLANLAWLSDVQVQTTDKAILINADYRKPLVLVICKGRKFYVDQNLVVLDYIAMPQLPIVQVIGLKDTAIPSLGGVWQRDDLTAAIEILVLLEQMDNQIVPDKPLLYEIKSIDVANFAGRKKRRDAHIKLYTTDDTVILWGAEKSAWQTHLEAPDEEKLAKLYNHYSQYGTLLNHVKYIELRIPEKKVPEPIDKY